MNVPQPGYSSGPSAPDAVDPQIVEQFQKVAANIRKVILGKDEVIARLLWAVAAQGHGERLLRTDGPGMSPHRRIAEGYHSQST